ncbi:MAG: PAS domain S-box protein [Anaerolineae bacterium]
MNNGHTGEDLTDRQSQPEDLLQFKAAFEHTNVGMAIVALDGRFKNVNRALCDMLGYTDAELMDKRFGELTHPDDVASSLTNLRLMLAGELTSFRAEKRYLHKGGDTVWVELTSTLVRDEQRQPLYFISQLQDIRLRKQAEQAAHHREDQFAEALRIARLANWEFDIATGNFMLNDQFYALLHTTAEREGGYVLSAERHRANSPGKRCSRQHRQNLWRQSRHHCPQAGGREPATSD